MHRNWSVNTRIEDKGKAELTVNTFSVFWWRHDLTYVRKRKVYYSDSQKGLFFHNFLKPHFYFMLLSFPCFTRLQIFLCSSIISMFSFIFFILHFHFFLQLFDQGDTECQLYQLIRALKCQGHLHHTLPFYLNIRYKNVPPLVQNINKDTVFNVHLEIVTCSKPYQDKCIMFIVYLEKQLLFCLDATQR